MLPIRKINPMEKENMKHKKMQELRNKIMGQRRTIALAKGFVSDPGKRKFIKKGILGIIMGIGIAVFSKVARAGGINFADASEQVTAPAVKLEGSNTTEATTTSTSEADLLSASGMSIATNLPIEFHVIFRKTSGAASSGFIGLKLNATSVALANNYPIGKTSNTDQAESRHASGKLGPRIANYLSAGTFVRSGTADGADTVGSGGMGTADMPAATITDVIIRGIVYNTSVTLGADELHVYSLAIS